MEINGLIAAPFTPMNSDGSVNLGVIKAYAGKLQLDGVKGAFVCGTTGEGLSLTLEERKAVLDEWLKYQKENFKVIAHVGTTSSRQSAELARHASLSGASAISSMGPPFFQPSRVEELVDFCKEIAGVAPDMPFYYYHIPSMTHVDLSMKEFLMQASGNIPNLQGIKYTHGDLMDLQQCMEFENGRFQMIYGRDEALLAGLAIGVKAAIGSTYNYMAPLFNELIAQVQSGNWERAKQLQRFAIRVVEILFKYHGGVVCGKAIQSICGIACGPNRSPLPTLSGMELKTLSEDLDNIRFFENLQSIES